MYSFSMLLCFARKRHDALRVYLERLGGIWARLPAPRYVTSAVAPITICPFINLGLRQGTAR